MLMPARLVMIVATAIPVSLAAQTALTVEGWVFDEDGAPIAHADVSALDVATGERREVVTRANGAFRILALSPGRYRLAASALGYAPGVQIAELVLGQRTELRFELRIAAVALEPIEVRTERAPTTEVTRSSVSTAVVEQEIRNLPLSHRSAMGLAALAPGIRSFRPLGGRTQPAAGALRPERFVNFYMDGVPLKNLFDGNLVGFTQPGSQLPGDALKEFRVYLHPYDAAYTGGAAFVLSALSHRGTNETQGSFFGALQPSRLVSDNSFLRAQPNFGDADFERLQVGGTLRGPIVKKRLFYAASYELSHTTNYVAVVPGRPDFNPGLWDQHAGVFEAPQRNHTSIFRLTYTPTDEQTFDAIASARHITSESQFGRAIAHGGAIRDVHDIHTVNLRHRWLATPRLANELSLQLVRWSYVGRALAPQPIRVYPSLQLGGGGGFQVDEQHIRLVNRLTRGIDDWHGSHLLNAGVEVARVSIGHFLANLERGRFDFLTDTSSLPRVARISVGLNQPGSVEEAFTSAAGWVLGAYLNDEWRPIRTLTLNLGLRYDADFGLLNNDFTVPWAADPELAAMPELQRHLNRGERGNDLDNISPRISLSWDLFDRRRTFLRGGFGIMYDRIPVFLAFQERRQSSWRTYVFNDPGTVDPEALRQRVASGEGRLASFTLLANDMDAPENRQWSIGVGHQFTPALALNADYVSQDVRNLFARVNVNWLDRSTSPPQRALSSRHGDIFLADDFARGRYRALLTQLTYQPDAELRLNLAYTLASAKADWDVENQNVPAATAGQFYVMQRISGDERHRLVLSGFGPLPYHAVLSIIATLASPRPYLGRVGQDINQNDFPLDDWLDARRYLVPQNRWRNWYRVVDVRLMRAFSLIRGTRMQGTVEVFNLFNAENYSSYDGRQRTPTGEANLTFRQPDQVFGTRQVQVGVRVEF